MTYSPSGNSNIAALETKPSKPSVCCEPPQPNPNANQQSRCLKCISNLCKTTAVVTGPCSVAHTGLELTPQPRNHLQLQASECWVQHQPPRPTGDYDLLIILIKLKRFPAVEKNVKKEMPLHSTRKPLLHACGWSL